MKYIQNLDIDQYCQLLENSQEERINLINYFFINVSLFFRDSFSFYYIYRYIFSEILKEQKNESIRIWSAGCSAGQEAYSLAILLKEYFNEENIHPDLYFFATDTDPEIIKAAKRAAYTEEHIQEVKFGYLKKYFLEIDNKMRLIEEIKNMVQFSNEDLLDENYAPKNSIFGAFDIIFCRNVLIYFNEKHQKVIFDKLYKSLSLNKILVLGESETIPSKYQNKFVQVNNCCNIYRRIN